MRKAQPFSSCINTLLRVISANNALQKARAGTRRGKLPPQLPLALWLRAGEGCPPQPAQMPTPQSGGDAATHSPKSWALRGMWQAGRRRSCPDISEHPWPQQRGRHVRALPCSCRSPFGLAGMLAEPRGDLWLHVPGCSSLEVVGQAQEGRQGALPMAPARRGRDQRSSDQQSPLPGTGELWQQGLESRD